MTEPTIEFLKGVKVKADHPITVLNPDPVFEIREVEIRNGNLYCRGENTMWFGAGLLRRAGLWDRLTSLLRKGG